MKKGKKSWKPSAMLSTPDYPGFQKRMVDTTNPDNYARRLSDGWKPVNQVTNGKAKAVLSEDIRDGKPMTSVLEHRGSVLMLLPDEDFEEHREYFREQTRRQTVGLRQKAEQRFQNRQRGELTAELYGETSIQRTIIK